jgi:hypothetical protein
MQISRSLNGRVERRLPIMIAVRLSQEADSPASEELVYTDNVSLHGVRVVSSRPWRTDESVHIEPVKEASSIHGQVVYCQILGDSFRVGVKFKEPVTWSLLTRYQPTPGAHRGSS